MMKLKELLMIGLLTLAGLSSTEAAGSSGSSWSLSAAPTFSPPPIR